MNRRSSPDLQLKASGAVYTPETLADFLAIRACERVEPASQARPLRVLDPAVGDGALLDAFRRAWTGPGPLELVGYDVDGASVLAARERLEDRRIRLIEADFLTATACEAPFDVVIANPPYVRTQVLGKARSRELAQRFDLKGRVDLSYAFMLAIADVLRPGGVAAILTSNRFMTTQAGQRLRERFLERFDIHHVWDLGDTKLFDAAVLPCVIVATRRDISRPGHSPQQAAHCTTIYSSPVQGGRLVENALDRLNEEGLFRLPRGECFAVQTGTLSTSDGIWRLATAESEAFLSTVASHTWKTFGDVGTIRVGIKTTADKVFIRKDWDEATPWGAPELLRPLITHHVAAPYRGRPPTRRVLYPHEVVDGTRRAVDLEGHPRAKAYLEANQDRLRGRAYVIDAGRAWYEIWVPHDPDAWAQPKLVFRDIATEPMAFIDLDGAVVNGDCYWMTLQDDVADDVLWLATAVANSTLAARFYDARFNNRLYAGRRRFITQYLRWFPLPDPGRDEARQAIALARALHSDDNPELASRLDGLVWHLFGLT